MKKVFKTAAVLALVVSSGQVLSDCGPGETRMSNGNCGVRFNNLEIIAPPIDLWNIPDFEETDWRDHEFDGGGVVV